MSDLTLNQNARMTDSLERDLLRGAMEEQSTPHPVAAIKRVAAGIGRGVAGFFSFVDEVNESMNRARAQSANYTGSQW
ncbi:hypothetical protein [Bordetella pseudohinzii]|uniref:Uncharacterized protein n=1 Tax=Bordetella pseudohinzii TaxID=1331258 RepID=A0A0J6C6Z2_9BORD|nr:hypothetical protein [Bordetella pseudohinzii]ANY14685.1 hypothetical protein BBN53_01535 [Bordetella pseudohinzii]KMM26883.1 hypothetical protein L540_13440 [Bordetella pseudohinzii]KXA76620.1 hypothetical protein AW878_17500 [Bordetella pseudohinzii]KXA76737.1 hypothetical protein AW877_15965 [Bordetella pseudohinzii]CUI60351.1 Uncharacterised protein [Bordetella pseudohinzii]